MDTGHKVMSSNHHNLNANVKSISNEYNENFWNFVAMIFFQLVRVGTQLCRTYFTIM